MNNFWHKLKKPFFVLAPMADVTDFAFREMFAKYGKPDVFWTEFVSCDGLLSDGKKILMRDLKYSEKQRPIVAQVFTSIPENMEKVSFLVKELGFDGIDINMGCPDKSIEKQKCGSYLIKDPTRAISLIKSAKKSGIPVSVKTRIGYNKEQIEEWIPILLNEDLDAISIHLRTRKEMSNTNAHWELMEKIVDIKNKINPKTLIIGNGDVKSIKEARLLSKQTKCDGVMIGRGAFGNPWLFNEKNKDINLKERLSVLVEHTEKFSKYLGDIKSFMIMKKHYKAYVSGFEGSKELRIKLNEAKDSKEIRKIVEEYITKI